MILVRLGWLAFNFIGVLRLPSLFFLNATLRRLNGAPKVVGGLIDPE